MDPITQTCIGKNDEAEEKARETIDNHLDIDECEQDIDECRSVQGIDGEKNSLEKHCSLI